MLSSKLCPWIMTVESVCPRRNFMLMPCILTVHIPWSKRYTHRDYRFLVFLVFAVLLFFNAAARLVAAVLFCLEAVAFGLW